MTLFSPALCGVAIFAGLAFAFVAGSLDQSSACDDEEKDRLRAENARKDARIGELELKLWQAERERTGFRHLYEQKVKQNANLRQYLVTAFRRN